MPLCAVGCFLRTLRWLPLTGGPNTLMHANLVDVEAVNPELNPSFSAMTLLVGSATRKTVSEMTYNVSSGTLNSTIPYLNSISGTAATEQS